MGKLMELVVDINYFKAKRKLSLELNEYKMIEHYDKIIETLTEELNSIGED